MIFFGRDVFLISTKYGVINVLLHIVLALSLCVPMFVYILDFEAFQLLRLILN